VRISILVPTTIVSVLVSLNVEGGAWRWVVLILVIALLVAIFIDGVMELRRANGILANAIADGLIRTPTLDQIETMLSGSFPISAKSDE
jgi:hypothetical protein